MVTPLPPPKNVTAVTLDSAVRAEADKITPAPPPLKDLTYLQIEVPQKYTPPAYSVKRQCSPGDMLVASPWKTY